MNSNLLTISALQKELDIGRSTAYRLIKSKKIKSGKVGRKIIIRRKDLEDYINQTIDTPV